MNMNHRDADADELRAARLTAYALGQIDPEERAEIETQLAASDEPRQTVEAVRKIAAHLRDAAQAQPAVEPSADLRSVVQRRLSEMVEQAMKTPQPSPQGTLATRRRSWRWLAIAACLMAAAVPVYLLIHPSGAGFRTAMEQARTEPVQSAPATPARELWGSHASRAEPGDVAARSGTRQASAESLDAMSLPGPAPVAKPADDATGLTGMALGRDKDKREAGDTVRLQTSLERQPLGAVSDPTSMPAENKPRAAPSLARLSAGEKKQDQGESGQALVPSYAGEMGGTGPGVPPGLTPGMPAAERPAMPQDFGVFPGAKPGLPQPSKFGGGNGYGSMPMPAAIIGPEGTVSAKKLAKDSSKSREFLKEEKEAAEDRSGESGRQDGEKDAPGTEQYQGTEESRFQTVARQPLSTFSIDTDTASYANVRRFLREGRLPPVDAVRIEEMINYFPYHYPKPEAGAPFSVKMEVTQCPWNGGNRLLRVALKGREIDRKQRGPSNLVFLLDCSGSMSDENKLPLVKQAMKTLVDQLTEDDRVAIVTYATTAGVGLGSTNATNKEKITQVIDSLNAQGSTNGGAGIQLAYEHARRHFLPKGTNRVILATDGDLNVGVTSDDDLVRLIRKEAKSGVFLTILGVGEGNLKDSKMEKLADRGNGVYHYVDSIREAQKVLVEQMSGSLVTIAKDVKIQIEFNPAEIIAYRLIGYDNRRMADHEFHDDRKDAGEIGAGRAVTALYELIPANAKSALAERETLKYQRVPDQQLNDAARTGELLTLRLRYKEPDGKQSRLLVEFPVKESGKRFGQASADFQFAAAVSQFGMILRNSPYRGNSTLRAVEETASSALADDPGGYRAEFLDLVRRAQQLTPR